MKSFDDINSVDILGTTYSVRFVHSGEDDTIEKGDLLGYTDPTVPEIVLLIPDDDVMSVKNIDWILRKVFRHECVHAFMLESGLDACNGWAGDEELVDWIARQFPKMMDLFKKLHIED